MTKYIVTHKYNLGTTFNSSNLRCKGWTSQVLTWLGKRILKNVSSPNSPDSKMRVLHILIYPTFNFNTNLPCSILALIKTIKGFTTRLVWWGILCGLSSLCLGRGHPEKDGILQGQLELSGNFQANTYTLLEASESWSWDRV